MQPPRGWWAGRRAACLAGALLALPAPARADGQPPDDQMGRRLQAALRAQGGDVHACYAEALARTPGAEGELLVQLEMGAEGAVRRVEIPKDQSSAPGLADCLKRRIAAWRMPELKAAAGDQVIFPLVFRPDDLGGGLAADVVIHEAAALRPGAGRPAAQVYIDADRQPGTQGSLTVLRLAPSERLALPGPAQATVLYVLSGQGQLVDGKGVAVALDPGDGILLSGAAPQALLAGPRGRLAVVQFFAPAGAEKGYLLKKPPPPAPAAAAQGPPLLIKGGRQEGARILDGQGRVKVLLGQDASPAASLAELTCEAGAQVPVHQHDTGDELLYIVSGRGVMTAGPRKDLPVGPGDAVRVPRSVPHALKVLSRLVAIQSYTPAGPEQRFLSRPAKVDKR